VLYFRGVLNFSLHYFFDAITDFETVIEKSEETQAKFYLARGRCYACLSMFKEAITDLSIAINLNKDLLDVRSMYDGYIKAYLNRGKCAYLIGDTGLAFMDFQKLIVLEPVIIYSPMTLSEKPNGSYICRQSADDNRVL
jgi:tetratricopeptide (TPR) repeat protein